MPKFAKINYYKLLNVNSDATMQEIKKAYFKQSRESHPDKVNKATANVAAINETQTLLNQAKEILLDANNRAEYDEFLASQPLFFREKDRDISAVVDGTQINLSSLILNAQISEDSLFVYAKHNLGFAFQLVDNPSLLARFSKKNFVKLILMVYRNVLSKKDQLPLLLNSKAVIAMMQSLNDYIPYLIQLSNDKDNIINFIKQQDAFFQKLDSNNLARLCHAMPELSGTLLTKENIQQLSVGQRNYISKNKSHSGFSESFSAEYANAPLSPKNSCQHLIQEIFFSHPLAPTIFRDFNYIKTFSQITSHSHIYTLMALLRLFAMDGTFIEDTLTDLNTPIGAAWFFQFCKKKVPQLNKHYNDNNLNYLRCFSKVFLNQKAVGLQEKNLINDITIAQWLELYPEAEKAEALLEWIIINNLALNGFSDEWQSFIVDRILCFENETNFFYQGFLSSPAYKLFFIENNLWQYFKTYPKALAKYLALPREHLTETINIAALPNTKQWPKEIKNILTAKQKLDSSIKSVTKLMRFDEYEKCVKLTGFYPELLQIKKMEAKVALDLASRALSCPNSKIEFGNKITELLNQAYQDERKIFGTQFIQIFKKNFDKPENVIILKEFIFPNDGLKLPNWHIVNELLRWNAVKTLELISIDKLSKLIETINDDSSIFVDKRPIDFFLQHPEVIKRETGYKELLNILSKQTSDFLQHPSFDIVERLAALNYPEEIVMKLSVKVTQPRLEGKIIGIAGLIKMKNPQFFKKSYHLNNIAAIIKEENICLESYDIKLAEDFIINNAKDIDYEKLEMLYQKFGASLHPLYEQYNLLPKLMAGRRLHEILSNTKVQNFESMDISPKDIFKECIAQLEQIIKQYGTKLENIPEIEKIINKMHEISVCKRDPQVNLFINKYILVQKNNLLQWLLQLAHANNRWAHEMLNQIVANGDCSEEFLKQDSLLIKKFLQSKLNKIDESICSKTNEKKENINNENIISLLNLKIIQYSDIPNLTEAQLHCLRHQKGLSWLLTKLSGASNIVPPITIADIISDKLSFDDVDTPEKRSALFLDMLSKFGFIVQGNLAEFKQHFAICYNALKLQFLQKENFDQKFVEIFNRFLTTAEYQEILAISKELGSNITAEKQKLLNYAITIAFNRLDKNLRFSITLTAGDEKIERLNTYLQAKTFNIKELCTMSDAQWSTLIYQPQMDIFCEYIGKQDLKAVIPETLEFNTINTKEKRQYFFLGKLDEAKLFDKDAFAKLKIQFPECYQLIKDLLLETNVPMIMAKHVNDFLSHHFYFQLCLIKNQLQKDQDDKSVKYLEQTLKIAIKEVLTEPSNLQQTILKSVEQTPKIVVDIDQKMQELLKNPIPFEIKKVNFLMRLARAVVGGLFTIGSGFLLYFNQQSFNYFFRPDRFVDTRAYYRVKYLYDNGAQKITQPNKEWVRDYLLDFQRSKMTKSLVHAAPSQKAQAIANIADAIVKQEDDDAQNTKVGKKIDLWLKKNVAEKQLLSTHRCFITSGKKLTKTQEVINTLCNSNVTLVSNKGGFRRQ